MPRKTQKDDVLRLFDRGYAVPVEFLEHIKREQYKREGLQSVWQCQKAHIYKSPIVISSVSCGECGKAMRKIWTRRGD